MLYSMLDQGNVNSFILYNLNQSNSPMKRMEYIMELSMQLVKPLLVKRLVTPTLRINLRSMIQDFWRAGDISEEMDIRHEFLDNKMSKQKRCNYRHKPRSPMDVVSFKL